MPLNFTTPHHQALLNDIYPPFLPYDPHCESCDLYTSAGHSLSISEFKIVNVNIKLSDVEPKVPAPLAREPMVIDRKQLRDFFLGKEKEKIKERIEGEEYDELDERSASLSLKSSIKLFGKSSAKSINSPLKSPHVDYPETLASPVHQNKEPPKNLPDAKSKPSKRVLEPPHLPNSTKLSLFIHYLNYKPAKIAKVFLYFEKKLKYDIYYRYYNNVLVALEIMKAILSQASGNFRMYYSSLLKMMLECLNIPAVIEMGHTGSAYFRDPLGMTEPIYCEILRNTIVTFWMFCRVLKTTTLLQIPSITAASKKASVIDGSITSRRMSVSSNLSIRSVASSVVMSGSTSSLLLDRYMFYTLVRVCNLTLFDPARLKLNPLSPKRSTNSFGGVDGETRSIALEGLLTAMQCDVDALWTIEELLDLYLGVDRIAFLCTKSYSALPNLKLQELLNSEIYAEGDDKAMMIDDRFDEYKWLSTILLFGIMRYPSFGEEDLGMTRRWNVITRPMSQNLDENQWLFLVKYLMKILRSGNITMTPTTLSPVISNPRMSSFSLSSSSNFSIAIQYNIDVVLMKESTMILIRSFMSAFPHKYVCLLLKEVIHNMDQVATLGTEMDRDGNMWMSLLSWILETFRCKKTNEMVLMLPILIKSLLQKLAIAAVDSGYPCFNVDDNVKQDDSLTELCDYMKNAFVFIMRHELTVDLSFDLLTLFLDKLSSPTIRRAPSGQFRKASRDFSNSKPKSGPIDDKSQNSLILVLQDPPPINDLGDASSLKVSPSSQECQGTIEHTDKALLLKTKFAELNMRRQNELLRQARKGRPFATDGFKMPTGATSTSSSLLSIRRTWSRSSSISQCSKHSSASQSSIISDVSQRCPSRPLNSSGSLNRGINLGIFHPSGLFVTDTPEKEELVSGKRRSSTPFNHKEYPMLKNVGQGSEDYKHINLEESRILETMKSTLIFEDEESFPVKTLNQLLHEMSNLEYLKFWALGLKFFYETVKSLGEIIEKTENLKGIRRRSSVVLSSPFVPGGSPFIGPRDNAVSGRRKSFVLTFSSEDSMPDGSGQRSSYDGVPPSTRKVQSSLWNYLFLAILCSQLPLEKLAQDSYIVVKSISRYALLAFVGLLDIKRKFDPEISEQNIESEEGKSPHTGNRVHGEPVLPAEKLDNQSSSVLQRPFSLAFIKLRQKVQSAQHKCERSGTDDDRNVTHSLPIIKDR